MKLTLRLRNTARIAATPAGAPCTTGGAALGFTALSSTFAPTDDEGNLLITLRTTSAADYGPPIR
jgi:hypothetical protein